MTTRERLAMDIEPEKIEVIDQLAKATGTNRTEVVRMLVPLSTFAVSIQDYVAYLHGGVDDEDRRGEVDDLAGLLRETEKSIRLFLSTVFDPAFAPYKRVDDTREPGEPYTRPGGPFPRSVKLQWEATAVGPNWTARGCQFCIDAHKARRGEDGYRFEVVERDGQRPLLILLTPGDDPQAIVKRIGEYLAGQAAMLESS